MTTERRNQEYANSRVERAAILEAEDIYLQYLKGDILLIPKPQLVVILEYLPEKAKYDSDSYRSLVLRNFQSLKESYEQNKPTTGRTNPV